MGTIRLFSTRTACFARQTGWGFVCALAFVLPASALNPNSQISQYAHTAWRSDAGIAAVRRIKQTPDGYLWLATRAGLVRFDGVRFTVFKAGVDTGLESSTIQDILIDPDGSMWVATLGGGLSHYQGGRFHTYTVKDGLPSLDINSLFRDSQGTLWVGTRGAGIARMVNGKFESLTVPVPPSRITGFLEDLDHSLWIATDGFGVFRLQNGTVRSFGVTDGLPDNRVLELYRDHAGRIWTAGWKGISSWDGVRFIANEAVNADVSEAISCFEDRDRNLWVGSTSGLLRVRGSEVARTDRSTGLSSDFVDDVFEDREGNLWVGTRIGLDRLRNDQIQSIGQPGPVVSDAQGVLTASNGQISRVAANGVHPLPVSMPRGANVFTVLSRPDAGLLVGTDKGALIWTGQHIHVVPELSKLSIRSMLQDRDGSVWIGTANRGLLHWNPSAGSRSLTETGVPDKWIITLAQDQTGALWAGSMSGGGLYRLQGGKVQHFGRDEGLRSTVIYSVFVDKDGELWIGSADGLSWFQDGAIRTVNSQQGLPADQIFAILDDSFNRIWLGGQIGITAIDKKSLSEWASGVGHKLEPVLYPFPRGVETGFPTQFFPSAARSTDGNLWFGGIGGLCEVTTSDPTASHTAHFPVLVEGVTVDSVLHNANEMIGIPPGTRSIEVRYTALTLSNAEAVRFRYRLEGMDKDWVDADTRRLAFYDNLKPGVYKFRVAARVGEEQWQESSTVMLEQLPFFYQTWWFVLLCAAAFLAVLWTLYQQRLHIVRQQYAAGLEATVGERMRVARELHDTLLQSFQGVAFQLQAARKLFLRKADNAEAALDEAIHATEEAIQEGRSAIRDLRPEPAAQRDLPELLNAVGNEQASAHEGNGHSPSYRVVVEGKQQDLSPMLQDEVYRVSREVIRNAFMHAAASHIEVEIRYDRDQLRLRVRDDGKGIDPKVLAGGQSGHFGIPGMRERAQRIGARLDFWSEMGAGTEVELTVPASMAYEKRRDGRRFRLFNRAGRDDQRT